MKQNCIIFISIILVLMVLSACSSNTSSTDAQITDTSVSTHTTDTSTFPPTRNASPNPMLPTTPTPIIHRRLPQIDSSTARIPITAAIYELFTNEYTYTGPEPLSSKTHGAWLNLADGKADIIFLVAPTAEELDYFSKSGVDIEMKIFGFDGLVFMGNELNPVQNLTVEQIRNIYRGNITNWKELGGADAKIDVYIRNSESGSQRLFESLVWDGYDMPDFSHQNFSEDEMYVKSNDMGDVTVEVLANEHSVGFNIMSYVDYAFEESTLKLFSVNGYEPTTKNFTSGNYPFLTTSYVAIRADEPEDSPARQLYDWIGSSESDWLISSNSTLSVSFSESVCIRTSKSNPEDNIELGSMILELKNRLIQRQELFSFTLEEIGFLKNGIYALSGKIFTNERYAQYFRTQSWYDGKIESNDKVWESFNDNQKKNLETILAYEKGLERALINQR